MSFHEEGMLSCDEKWHVIFCSCTEEGIGLSRLTKTTCRFLKSEKWHVVLNRVRQLFKPETTFCFFRNYSVVFVRQKFKKQNWKFWKFFQKWAFLSKFSYFWHFYGNFINLWIWYFYGNFHKFSNIMEIS